MTPAELDPATLQQRYGLLCRALQATPAADDPQPVLDTVGRLDDLIHRELLELARLGSPDDFADIYLGFTRELARFREFCADPRLAEKTVVAFGGPFSAGKSSLINALIGKKLLVVEVDPTTALPAYVLAGEADTVHALNLHRLRVPLVDEELASLTHDETHRYGSQVARALSAAFITRRDFPWANLAFIDTPGYTGRATAGDRTDANLAAAQLAGAHAIVWIVSIKQGNLTEEDLAFLARLDPEIPRIVVASHADQVSEEDRAAVVQRMADTLAARNLMVEGVFPVSARPRQAELLAPLRAQLDAWNQAPHQQRFAHRFKALFTRYQRGLERDLHDVHWQLHRINRIATLANGAIISDATELKTVIDERLVALKTVESRLHELGGRFFGELKRAGDAVGIPLPEPHEVELLEPGHSNLLEQLVALRKQEGREEPDMRSALSILRRMGNPSTRPVVLRRPATPMSSAPLKLLQSHRSLQISLLESMKGAANEEQLKFKPLPDHFIAPQSEHLRQHYALLLAAVLTTQSAISEPQTRLFSQLLESIRLGDILGTLFDQARNLHPERLLEAMCLSREAGVAHHLLVDALVLLCLDAQLGDEAAQLVGELAAFLELDRNELAFRAVDASEIIGLNATEVGYISTDKVKEGNSNIEAEEFSAEYISLAELWPAHIRKRITIETLRKGLRGGIWELDANLFVNFPWQASGAILLFRNGATLNTLVDNGEVNLSDCYLVDASLNFQGKCRIKLERSDWMGNYEQEAKRTALKANGRSLTVTDCQFSTRNARAIAAQDCDFFLTGSRFTHCGHVKLNGGAVSYSYEKSSISKAIENCRFYLCVAALGGALYFNRVDGVKKCEFVACESRDLRGGQGEDIAVYAQRATGGGIADCVFRQTSLSIGSVGYVFAHIPCVESTQFQQANLYSYDHYEKCGFRSTITSGCHFTDGRAIEKRLF